MKFTKKLLSLLLVAMLLVTAIPFQAMAAESIVYEYTVVLNGEEIEGGTDKDGKLQKSELIAWLSEGDADVEAALKKALAGMEFPIILDPDDVTVIDIEVDWEEGDDEEEDDGEFIPDDEEEGDYYTVIVDYTEGSEGEPARKYEMVEGQQFGESRLPANPQRNGMTFEYWYYAETGEVVTASDLFDPEQGTLIKAMWNVKGHFLTLDENRQGEEYVNYGVTVYDGEAIYAKVYKHQPTRKGYVFMGWFLNGKKITPETIYDLGDSATAYAKWDKESDVPGVPNPPEKDGKIYLEIYANGKTGDLVKRVNITDYAKDGKITREEVEKVAKKYVKAQSGKKLAFDGIFDEETWYWYTRDEETDGAASIEVDLWNDHYIFVMVKNVKSTTNADSTNPKTGDFLITGAMTMMAASSIAAAAVYVTGKKRK